MYYFEVRKLPREAGVKSELQLLLPLFRAKTEEELKQLERLEAPVETQAIEVYREITVSPEFRELERQYALARHNEASALAHAKRKEAEKWQSVIAERDARIAELEALLKKNQQT
jgi:hypothetical protein